MRNAAVNLDDHSLQRVLPDPIARRRFVRLIPGAQALVAPTPGAILQNPAPAPPAGASRRP